MAVRSTTAKPPAPARKAAPAKKAAPAAARSTPARPAGPAAAPKRPESPSKAGSTVAQGLKSWGGTTRGLGKTEPLPDGGVKPTKKVEAGSNLTRESERALEAAGFANPSQTQVQQANQAFKESNNLPSIDRIQAGSELKTPEDLRRGELFNRLSQSVMPGEGQYGMPAAGFTPETKDLVQGKDGLAGLAAEHGSQAVEKMFNDHMTAIGRDYVRMDTSGSPQDAINFTLRNSRDHFSMGAIAGFNGPSSD
ncbi:MAG: hypothetical protein AB7S38_16525 [Vulcanimicrobiota bacterium]